MKYRKLCKNGEDVSIIGLGGEFLFEKPTKTVVDVISASIEGGMNYLDCFMPWPKLRDDIGLALKGRRDKMMVAGHLGTMVNPDGQYHRTRDMEISRRYFEDLFTRLHTDYIDILQFHFIDKYSDYEQVFEGEFLEYAHKLKKQGRIRHIGISSHMPLAALKAVESGEIDVVMFSVNPAFDMIFEKDDFDEFYHNEFKKGDTIQLGKRNPARQKLYAECERRGVGIVTMKTYGGGHLITRGVMTAVQAIQYALDQPGVVSALPGCQSVYEVEQALAYLDATDEQRDYTKVFANGQWDYQGVCMYCGHCMPCPSKVDVAAVTKQLHAAQEGMTDVIRESYAQLEKHAEDCVECKACVARCPFDVDIMKNIRAARELFGY